MFSVCEGAFRPTELRYKHKSVKWRILFHPLYLYKLRVLSIVLPEYVSEPWPPFITAGLLNCNHNRCRRMQITQTAKDTNSTLWILFDMFRKMHFSQIVHYLKSVLQFSNLSSWTWGKEGGCMHRGNRYVDTQMQFNFERERFPIPRACWFRHGVWLVQDQLVMSSLDQFMEVSEGMPGNWLSGTEWHQLGPAQMLNVEATLLPQCHPLNGLICRSD